MPVYLCVYRGYRVEGILYGQQEDLVAAVGVVSIGWPGDSLGCGVIKVRLLTWWTDGQKYDYIQYATYKHAQLINLIGKSSQR